ncbi:MAG: UDP-N-acetyl-D-mannosamine dehydrogenase [Planctomycetia bacterium]|nr:UDP-N-acetyl-D-mannosamine dehydrogenase [Planctomycetia bacterium]
MAPFGRVVVVGLGYIGLPTAATIANANIDTVGVDVNPEIVQRVNAGQCHIIEAGLGDLVARVVRNQRLRASTQIEQADAFIVTVPTPFQEGHVPDLSYVDAAIQAIAPAIDKGNLVILESTSPVGTTRHVAEQLAALRPDLSFPQQAEEQADIQVAHCPERVIPGQTLRELIQNDRIIGGLSPRCARRAAALYRCFVTGRCLLTDADTAELAKLAENAFRDVNIAFANELSLLCDRLGIDVWELIRLTNCHPRVNVLQPGPGVGGHCIAVDPWFIVHTAPEQSQLIRTARAINDAKPHWVVEQVLRAARRYEHPVIACLGLSYKPDIDDLRESPAMEIVAHLARSGVGRILAVEPHVESLPQSLADLPVTLESLAAAAAQADVLVALVNHRAFAALALDRLAGKCLLDFCGAWQNRTRAVPEQELRLAGQGRSIPA